ncbi:hypothetical protein QT971_14640 [Microcoleus sp. herbarium19]|uniref:hypothetical protein n=1 Tax=unclassified Microcoleus TaxID=2642155 RepID=UPI002FD0DEDA
MSDVEGRRKKEEGSSAADFLADVTDVTDVTDVSPMEEGRRKKERKNYSLFGQCPMPCFC